MCDVDIVTSHLAFLEAMVGYCAVKYAVVGAIMDLIPKMMQRCPQSWRDVWDAMPPQAGFTNFVTHVNRGVGPEPPCQCWGRLCGECGHQASHKSVPHCKSR
jgi:hypothetical protein